VSSNAVKNEALHLVFEWLASFCMWLAPPAARLVGRAAGIACYFLLGRERRRAECQLLDRYDRVLGLAGDAEATRVRRVRATAMRLFGNLGCWAAEACSYAVRIGEIQGRVDLPGRSEAVLREALGRGRGVLFLTGHLGHWELMAWALAARGFPVSAVGRASYHPGITDLVGWLRSSSGVEIILRDDAEAPRRLLGALARGRIVGLFVDQSTSLPSRQVPFLGLPAPTIEAPARLALRHRGSVVFGSCHESPGGRLCIEVEPVTLPPGGGLDEALAVVNRHAEKAITAFPDHWVWMHERWRPRVSRSS